MRQVERAGHLLVCVGVLLLVLLVATGSPSSAFHSTRDQGRGWYGSVVYDYHGVGKDRFGHNSVLFIHVTVAVSGTSGRVRGASYSFSGWGPLAPSSCPGLTYHNSARGEFSRHGSHPISFDQLTPGKRYAFAGLRVPMTLFEHNQVASGRCTAEPNDIVLASGLDIPLGIGHGDISRDKVIAGLAERKWPDCRSPGGVDTRNAVISCHDEVWWTLARKKLKTPEDVARYSELRDRANRYAAWLGVAAAACAKARPSARCDVLGLGAAAEAALGSVYDDWANDPPDPRFRRIAEPRPPSPPRITAGPRLDKAAAAAFNALLDNQSLAIGLTRALVTAIERSQGAEIANDSVWQQRQLRAARRYAARLAVVLDAEPRKRRAARTALERSRFPTIMLGRETVQQLQEQVVKNGLPPALTADLRRLGFTKSQRKDAEIEMATHDARELVKIGSFPAALTNPPLLRATRAAADRLARFSKKR